MSRSASLSPMYNPRKVGQNDMASNLARERATRTQDSTSDFPWT